MAIESKSTVNVWDWIWRAGFLAMLALQAWISSNYVSKSDFEKALGKLGEVSDRVIRIEEGIKSNDGVQARVQSLSDRVNILEREGAAREIRMTALEKRIKL